MDFLFIFSSYGKPKLNRNNSPHRHFNEIELLIFKDQKLLLSTKGQRLALF